MRDSPGCPLHPNASFVSIPACITVMQAGVRPPAVASTKHPAGTLQGLEVSVGTLGQELERDKHPMPFSDPLTPSEALLSARALSAGSLQHSMLTPRAKPLGMGKPLQMMPRSLGIIDGVFTTSWRPVPG